MTLIFSNSLCLFLTLQEWFSGISADIPFFTQGFSMITTKNFEKTCISLQEQMFLHCVAPTSSTPPMFTVQFSYKLSNPSLQIFESILYKTLK